MPLMEIGFKVGPQRLHPSVMNDMSMRRTIIMIAKVGAVTIHSKHYFFYFYGAHSNHRNGSIGPAVK